MRRVLAGGLVSVGTTFLAAPIVRALLIRSGSMDVPNHRSSHDTPIPRGGGIACLLGVGAGVLTVGQESGLSRRVVGGVLGLALLGLADDQLGHVHHNVRIAGQVLAGLAFAESAGSALPAAAGTVSVVNVVNFMDGINGMSGATAVSWGLSTIIAGREAQDSTLQTLGAITAGTGLGFLPWNAPHAKMFLGDVGSYLLGGLMAAGASSAFDRPRLALRVAAPLLPYGLDAAQALVLRARDGKQLTEAHRDHSYQQLVDRHGLSHTQAALAHAAAASLIACAWANKWSTGTAGLLSVCVASAYATSPRWLKFLRDEWVQGRETT